jgi:hypothetical protein
MSDSKSKIPIGKKEYFLYNQPIIKKGKIDGAIALYRLTF